MSDLLAELRAEAQRTNTRELYYVNTPMWCAPMRVWLEGFVEDDAGKAEAYAKNGVLVERLQ